MPTDQQIATVRRFNRFYTRRIGVLTDRLLRSRFSLAEVRVMYELAHRSDPTAAEIARELGYDGGYLSRLLKDLMGRGLVGRRASVADARRRHLHLTQRGRAAFQVLDARSNEEVRDLLDPLGVGDRNRLIGAMEAIEDVLGAPPVGHTSFVLRPHGPGDMGWVLQRHGVLYFEEYGWDARFEALVASIVAEFLQKSDSRRERCWIAEKEGEPVGSVFLVRGSDTVAKLRLLLVEPSARGLGIGRRLVEECIRFARQVGYLRISLWTNSLLLAARGIYEATGFRLVQEEPHQRFGSGLIGQTWELDL